jgi:hypothetical protein
MEIAISASIILTNNGNLIIKNLLGIINTTEKKYKHKKD